LGFGAGEQRSVDVHQYRVRVIHITRRCSVRASLSEWAPPP
jgi:hypothetical protein